MKAANARAANSQEGYRNGMAFLRGRIFKDPGRRPRLEDVARSFQWYPGSVVFIKQLRPDTQILDQAIPGLLRRVRQPTFVTINTTDFWRRIRADERYCVLCFPLPHRRAEEAGARTRRLFRLPEFKTKNARMGKVVLVGSQEIHFYQAHDQRVQTLSWGEDDED